MTDNPTMLGCAKKDKWVGPFVRAVGGRMMQDLDELYANTTLPMVYSGISKTAARTQAEKHSLDYWYIDTGYLGNLRWKTWFRITKNGFQVTIPMQNRPADRLQRLPVNRTQYRRGSQIMIVPIDGKIAEAYSLPNPDEWLEQTIAQIKLYTDRPIVVRTRPASREIRTTKDTFAYALQQNINAVVVWSSNCGVEAAQHGIPVISLGPSASSYVSANIKQIDQLPELDQHQVEMWLRWLSYNQFNQQEVENLTAWKILQQNYECSN